MGRGKPTPTRTGRRGTGEASALNEKLTEPSMPIFSILPVPLPALRSPASKVSPDFLCRTLRRWTLRSSRLGRALPSSCASNRIRFTATKSLRAYGKFFTDKIVDYLYLAFVKCGCLFTQIFYYIMIQFI